MIYDPYLAAPTMPSLRASVFVSPPTPWSKPNGSTGGPWSPISSTLIHGLSAAVLVDTAITNAQNGALADWVAAQLAIESGNGRAKKLEAVYVTHGHADHWLGIGLLTRRFPGVRVLATAGTVRHMREQGARAAMAKTWLSQFPGGQVDGEFDLDLVEELPASGEFELEGHTLQAVEVGHSDTHDSTVLWVEGLKLAVCGDVVYGDVHQMLGAANTKELREEWVRAIEMVEALGPQMVVPGHKKEGEMDGVYHLEASKRYIRDFGRLVESGEAKDARELSAKMLELYPTRFNTGALLVGCMSAFHGKRKDKKGKL